MARKIIILYTLGTIDRELFEKVRDFHIRHRDISASFGSDRHEPAAGVIFAIDPTKLKNNDKVAEKIAAVMDFYHKSETQVFECAHDSEKEILKVCKQALKKVGDLDDGEDDQPAANA